MQIQEQAYDAEDVVRFLRLLLRKVSGKAVNSTSVIDQHMNGPYVRNRLLDEALHLVCIRHIRCHRQCATAAQVYFLGGLVQVLLMRER